MAPRKLYFEHVRLGDELPATAKAPVDRVQIARYACAANDFSPQWLDEPAAKALGMPSVMAPPGMAMGFLSQFVTEWARGARVRQASARFTRMVWPGDTLICKGRVFDRHAAEGRAFIEVEAWAENQRGELVVKGHLTLQLYYSADDEQRARSGQPPIVVSVPRSSIVVEAAAAAASPPRRGGSKKASKAKANKPAKSAAKPARKPAPKRQKQLKRKKK